MKGRIKWRSRQTGYCGRCGDWLPIELARAWLEHAQKEWGHIIDHWLEEADKV